MMPADFTNGPSRNPGARIEVRIAINGHIFIFPGASRLAPAAVQLLLDDAAIGDIVSDGKKGIVASFTRRLPPGPHVLTLLLQSAGCATIQPALRIDFAPADSHSVSPPSAIVHYQFSSMKVDDSFDIPFVLDRSN